MKTLYLLPLSIILLTSCESKIEKLEKTRDIVWDEQDKLWDEMRVNDSLSAHYEDSLKTLGIRTGIMDDKWLEYHNKSWSLLSKIEDKQDEYKRLGDKIRNLELGLEVE